jgi:hypothetical protein
MISKKRYLIDQMGSKLGTIADLSSSVAARWDYIALMIHKYDEKYLSQLYSDITMVEHALQAIVEEEEKS